MPETKQYAIDVEGTDIVTTVLRTLLNQFPGLEGKRIEFSTLGKTSGLGFFPTSGAVLLSNKEDITGHVKQVCLYPFTVVYRAAPKDEKAKIRMKELFDTLGKWLEMQPIKVSQKDHQLENYPNLEQGRVIKSINRTNPAHLDAAYKDGIEDWIIALTLKYESEFDK